MALDAPNGNSVHPPRWTAMDIQNMELLSPVTTRPSKRNTRRLSNQSVSRADLFAGPAVVAPPELLETASNAHETALAMEMAKHNLAEASETSSLADSGPVTPAEVEGLSTTDRYAFAFDIDGVLIRGGHVIPEAIEAMKVLNGQNEYNITV